MKNLILVLVLLIAIQGAIYAQSCLPDGILFETQAQLDSFQVNYPGCKEIDGDVIIYVNDVTDFNGLNQITTIGGKLHIACHHMTEITGLDSLTYIGGDLELYSNDSLSDLTGLGNLTFIGGALRISYNSSLTSLSGFDNLTEGSITYLQITRNYSLSLCEAQWICDYLSSPNGPVEIYNNGPGCNKPPEIASACGITDLCLPFGNYYFKSQADIDIFQSDYPNCTGLEGMILINGGDISNLKGLINLTSIGGTLEIENCWELKSLSGLEGVTSIGTLYLVTDQLTNLSGLDGLTAINGNLSLNTNLSLQNLVGLEGVNFIGGGVSIYRNFVLKSLTGLEGLLAIGGDLHIGNLSSSEGNYQMTSLSGLDNLTSIGGALDICSNEILTDLTALGNLTSIEGNLRFSDNESLQSLAGLDSLSLINGDLIIAANPFLTNITGLANLEVNSISNIDITNNSSLSDCDIQCICEYLSSPNGIVRIFNNADGCNNPTEIASDCGITLPCLPFGNYYFLTQTEVDSFQTNYPGCTVLQGIVSITGEEIHNLDGLSVLTSIDGILNIGYADNLTSLAGLDNLTSIEGNISLYDNIALTDMTGLGNLTSIGGNFYIQDNEALTNFIGLDNLTSVGGSIYIEENDVLTNLIGLDSLTSITGSLYISNHKSLISLMGLENLDSIGGNLGICLTMAGAGNIVLNDITAFENLTFIGGDLIIEHNRVLESLAGLDNIEAGSIINLSIAHNQSLATCDVQGICNYLASPNGTIEIHDNAYYCDSQYQVEFYCGVGIDESAVGRQESAVNIFPNPSSTQITIETKATTSKFLISIFNLNGQEVNQRQITEPRTMIDISHLPQGLYFVKITGDDTVEVLKMVKQ